MKNINVGIVNYVLSKKYENIFLNENVLDSQENSGIFLDYIDTIKSSPILMLENKVFNKLENKTILNESLAIRYVDKTINLFDVYTEDELLNEHKKIKKFVNSADIKENKKIDLYNAIGDLIIESISENEEMDIDTIHESFMTVLNHVMTEKEQPKEDVEDELINEHVLQIAINKFNDRYSKNLNENEFGLLKGLLNKDFDEKQEIFENYKNKIFDILNNMQDVDYKEKIDETVNKINLLKIDENNIDENILNLYDLSNGIEMGIEN